MAAGRRRDEGTLLSPAIAVGRGGGSGPTVSKREVWASDHLSRSPHLPTGLGGDLKRSLEGSPLLCGEDGPGPFGPSRVLPIVSTALTLAALPLCRLHVSIFVLTLHCEYTIQPVNPCFGPLGENSFTT